MPTRKPGARSRLRGSMIVPETLVVFSEPIPSPAAPLSFAVLEGLTASEREAVMGVLDG